MNKTLMRAIMLGVSVVLVSVPYVVEAQSAPVVSIPPGQRIRVTSLNSGLVEKAGIALYSRGDSLGMRVDGSNTTTVIPMTIVEKLEVSGGSRRHALHGLGAGVLLGVLAGATAKNESQCDWGPDACVVEDVATGAAVVAGTIVFGLLGTGIGALIKTEKWTTVPTGGSRVGFHVLPGRNGMTLAGGFRF